jgi:putative PIN family toxin of toxin-antitoxin system
LEVRAVLDANVIVSGIARYAYGQTSPSRALLAAVDGRYTLVTSEVILGEVELALSKAYFGDRFDERYLTERLSEIRSVAETTELTQRLEGVATHWQDGLVLSTALSGGAEYLVTGDRELLHLDHSYAFRIVHPNEFLAVLQREIADH